jgi:hypothetical protein
MMSTATIDVVSDDLVTVETEPTRASRPVPAFHDVERAPIWMRAIGTGLVVGGLLLAAAVLAWPGEGPEIAMLVPALLGVVAGLLMATARTGITIDERAVHLHFRPLPSRRIRRSRIVSARLVEADARSHGGIGLRFGRHRRSLMLTPGLGIEFIDARGRITFVRVRRVEAAFRALAV